MSQAEQTIIEAAWSWDANAGQARVARGEEELLEAALSPKSLHIYIEPGPGEEWLPGQYEKKLELDRRRKAS